MAAPSMEAMATTYGHQDVGFMFLYTHEAHPGEFFPHLTSMDQKFEHARSLREVYEVARPIYLDSLGGDCHRVYGSMPNMSWIFTRQGTPLYKSDWTDARSLALALDYYLEVDQRRQSGQRLAPFRAERLDFRNVDQAAFFEGLARNGPKAVKEFSTAFRQDRNYPPPQLNGDRQERKT